MNPILRAGVLIALIATAPPPTNRFLLLDSRQLVEGEIELVGENYRVRRDGGETLFPAARVLALCDDRAAAYRILRDKIDARNVEAHLKLAEWCHANGLPKEAVVEARAAVELRPNYAVAQRFLRFYEQAAARPVTQVEIAKTPDAPAPLPESVECSPEALLQFCTKVQRVLMNACVSCHAATGKFRLQRVYSNTTGGRAA